MSSRKNILVIGTTDNRGGAASVSWSMHNSLSDHGYEIRYLVAQNHSHKPYVESIIKESRALSCLDRFTGKNISGMIRMLKSYLFANDLDYGAESSILEHPWYKQADIIHLHNLHGSYFRLDTLLQMDQEKKIVWTLHDTWAVTGKCAHIADPHKWESGYHKCDSLSSYPPMLWDNTRYLWNKKKSIYSQLKNTTIVTPSRWLGDIVGNSILEHLPHRFVYNGVDTKQFYSASRDRARSALGIPLTQQVVLMVGDGGKANPYKGWEYANNIQSDPQFADILFLAVGGKNSREGNIWATGPIPHDKLVTYYQAADVFLFPSITENCPLVVLEAMACGLPVVAFNVGGVPELIGHKVNGYIAKYKDARDLSVGLSWQLGLNNNKRLSMSKKNIKRVKTNYSLTQMIENYQELYES